MNDHGDAFTGYLLRRIEERLARVETKIDALATEMTPAERAALIQRLNQDAVRVGAATDVITKVATTLDKTAQP